MAQQVDSYAKGGIIRLREPLKLIYSIRLKQKSNPEPLNPEPVNGCEIFIRDAWGRLQE
jgi:hypothetical protein